MAQPHLDPRVLSSDLAKIEAELKRDPQRVDELFVLAQRLSRVATNVTLACERAYLIASEEVAA